MTTLICTDGHLYGHHTPHGLEFANEYAGTNATKASFKESCLKGKGTTDAGTTWLTSYTTGSSITWTTGEEQICSSSQAVKYALWHVDNSSKIQNSSGGYDNYTKNVWDEMSSSSSYPTDWNADGSGFSSFFEL